METRTFSPSLPYLSIPVYLDGEPSLITIWVDGGLFTEMDYTTNTGVPDSYQLLCVPEGSALCVAAPRHALDLMENVDEASSPNPTLASHFLPHFGWINDPNGCILDGDTYHLFYQHNPLGRTWGNMSWGHATSTDLVNWKEQPVALLPHDHGHTVFSGSGAVEDGVQHYLYSLADTAPTPQFTQHHAYSTDGGKTLVRDGEAIGVVQPDSRDPKVFHYNGQRYMVLWTEGNTFSLFRSQGWKHWQEIQQITLEGFWECPDMIRIADGLWIFTEAGGRFMLATFDGREIHTFGNEGRLFLTDLAYASQTFCDSPVMVTWLRTQNLGLPSCGSMGIPRILGWDGKHVTKTLVPQFMEAFTQRQTLEGRHVELDVSTGCLLLLACTAPVTGSQLSYDPQEGTLLVGSTQVQLPSRPTRLSIVIDSFIMEVSDAAGTDLAYFEIIPSKVFALCSEECMIVEYSAKGN